MNLVTGGTGLLGSHIVEQLRKRERPVRCLVRRGSDTSWLQSQGVELTVGDLNDIESLRKACEGVQVIYHSAARVGDWGPWDEFVTYTINGTANLVDAAHQAGVDRFIHISSISAYGHVNGDGLVLDETAPLGRCLNKWSYYSRAKVEAENIVWQAHRDGKIKLTVIRPSWLYGPRDRATLARMVRAIRRRKAKLIGKGDNRLNVVYAGNVAEACIAAADSDKAIGQAYNCSNDGLMTQAEYFNRVAAALGEPPVTKSVPYKVAYNAAFLLECVGHLFKRERPPLVTRYSVWLMGRKSFFSAEKARRELNWQPTVTYEQGIPMTVQWYLENCDENH
jgi:nucleoside-diphosphate-sugar epimerase